MEENNKSEIKLAVVGSLAAIFGGVVTAIVGSIFVDANTERTTNVQLIGVAIDLLSAKEKTTADTRGKVLREWAVDTINATAKVKFNAEARQRLIDGEIKLSHGAIRLAAGGGLFALPIVGEAMQGKIGDNKGGVNQITIDRDGIGKSFKLD